jgi:DNA (cytosine-5)-methyltransferase 1
MKFGSVCSGIEAASVAWHPLGWKAAWLSEIEPFPCAVLKHHYPDVPNHGDMTLLPEKILSGEVEAPDLFCGGTPCQAFSVAGLRNSLDDARGNLSLTFVGIANAIDHVRSVRRDAPAIIFWENVPGVLNTKDNAFGCFLGALAGEINPITAPGERWSNAGCVFGPQRTVAWRVLDAQYFGVAQRRRRVFVIASARDDINPTEILFEFEGVRRDTAPSREKGQRIAPCVTNGPPFSRTGNERVEAEAMVVWPSEVAPTLTSDFGDKLGQNNQHIDSQKGGFFVPSVLQPIAFTTEQTPKFNLNQALTLTKQSPTGGGQPQCVSTSMAVRRLTPTECERLQGFPDGYTNIPWRKAAESPDGPRYKALGNSWAVPVVRWIGQRIQDQINAT